MATIANNDFFNQQASDDASWALPAKRGSFDGLRAGDATLRRANAAIEQVRKGDFAVTIQDAAGKPFAGPVTLRHVRHEFHFGVNLQPWASPRWVEGDHRSARDAAAQLFNMARDGTFMASMLRNHGPDDAFAFDPVDNPEHGPAWARSVGMALRWHCLLYAHPGPTAGGRLPPWHADVPSKEVWWAIIERYFTALHTRNRGWFEEYDVINEMHTCRSYYDQYPQSTFPRLNDPADAKRCFDLARRCFPGARLVALEWWRLGSIIDEHGGTRHQAKIFQLYQDLLDLGADIDILGSQGHYGVAHPCGCWMENIDRELDRLGALGKPVAITEFNPPTRPNDPARLAVTRCMDEEELADWEVNFHTLCFSKPYLRQITRWNLLDGVGGMALDGGVLRADGTPKPQFHALNRLFHKTWTTRWDGVPRTDGRACFRGFFGTYEVEAEGHVPVRIRLHADESRKASVRLAPAP